jgi:hypothetical protein
LGKITNKVQVLHVKDRDTHALDIVILEQMQLKIAEHMELSNNPVGVLFLLFTPHVSHTVATNPDRICHVEHLQRYLNPKTGRPLLV